jgi:hypothetical protein
MKKLKNFQVELYLQAWIYNVGFNSSGPELTLNDAMMAYDSLIEWFQTDNVDYDEDFALEFMREAYNAQQTMGELSQRLESCTVTAGMAGSIPPLSPNK